MLSTQGQGLTEFSEDEYDKEYEEYLESVTPKKKTHYLDFYKDEKDWNSFGDETIGKAKDWKKDFDTTDWRGYEYYLPIRIDYRYVEQMANALSARHNIKVELSQHWAIDLNKRILFYNPQTLMYGTKADVMVALLHEIGHLRFSRSYELLKHGTYSTKYHNACFMVLNLFEDYRVDERMMNAYSASQEIYLANGRTVLQLAEKYSQKAKFFRDINNVLSRFSDNPGVSTEISKAMSEFIKRGNAYSLYDYMQGMIFAEANLPINDLPKPIQGYVKKTLGWLDSVKKIDDEQEVLDCLEKHVYPVIEELLKTFADPSGKSTMVEVRVVGAGKDPVMPKEWQEGDYTSLRASVDSAIKELVRKLRNIRVKDLTQRWDSQKRRGVINVKDIYRFASNNYRIFKKKIPMVDRLNELAFSILVDISVSMEGPQQIEATRGTIILAETAEALGIPCEIICFGYHGKVLKTFGQTLDRKLKRKIGGIVSLHSGGTNLFNGLLQSQIKYIKGKKRCILVLTDGETAMRGACLNWFELMQSKGVATYGFDLSQRDSGISRPVKTGVLAPLMGKENVRMIDNACQLPKAFEELIKSVAEKVESDQNKSN